MKARLSPYRKGLTLVATIGVAVAYYHCYIVQPAKGLF
jgi:hypothetical protein